MADISKRHELSCGACGESGYLSLTRGDDSDWSFACYGFAGLAVDHCAYLWIQIADRR